MCIKVIRTRNLDRLREIEKVHDSLVFQRYSERTLFQAFRRVSEGGKRNPHPNVLPTIGVSETLFPLCIMTPWMPDGNITQYTQTNPGANRLTLVRVHRLEDQRE